MSNDVNFGTKQWYVVNTYSGRERAVADMLEKRKYTQNLENYIFRIVVAETVEPGMKMVNLLEKMLLKTFTQVMSLSK